MLDQGRNDTNDSHTIDDLRQVSGRARWISSLSLTDRGNVVSDRGKTLSSRTQATLCHIWQRLLCHRDRATPLSLQIERQIHVTGMALPISNVADRGHWSSVIYLRGWTLCKYTCVDDAASDFSLSAISASAPCMDTLTYITTRVNFLSNYVHGFQN